MSLSIIPLVILGQITEASINDDASLYQMTFKDTNGVPLYGVTAVWTDEQTEIKALAAQKSYGVWINPVDGEFTIKFAGYTYKGSADLTDPNVLAGITAIEFNNEAAGGGGGGGGSGDFSTATISVINRSKADITLAAACAIDTPTRSASIVDTPIRSANTLDATVILYKGKAVINIFGGEYSSYSGAIEPIGEGSLLVTGDCSVIINGTTN